jgi:hypothetical protein
MAEIRANHQILVVEDAMGLIVGSAAQRLNGMSSGDFTIINMFQAKDGSSTVSSGNRRTPQLPVCST